MKQVLDLNGQWHYSGKNEGIITIPGAIEQKEEERDYEGTYRFWRTFSLDMPEKRHRYILEFDGVSYWCRIYCNKVQIREHEGIWDSFQADITEAVKPGENLIEVELKKPNFRKDDPYYFRSILFGFIPDIMLPFGGIWRDVRLRVTGEVYFTRAVPRFCEEEKKITVQTEISGLQNGEESVLTIRTEVTDPDGCVNICEGDWVPEVTCALDEISLWSPSAPAIYRGKIVLCQNGIRQDEAEFSGGFRRICAKDGKIWINDMPFYMRGVLHWGCYPEKMLPSPSREEVKEELRRIKEMGFNTVKHCLYFPPKYYYELCDEMGIVTWQELPLWLPYKKEYVEERIFRQYPKMLDYFLHYPTILLVSLGCELDDTIDSGILNRLYQMIKMRTPQILVCDNSGSGECFGGEAGSESDIYDYHFYAELYELNELIQEFTAGYRKGKPWVFGEYNDSDTFRLTKEGKNKWWLDPDEKKNPRRKVHKGFDSDQPVYYQREILREYGVLDEAEGLKELSVRQMMEIRKFILETTRSFPEIDGYNITTLRDVPGTTAGIFDDLMESKVTPEWMRKVNGEVVVSFQKNLAREWKNGSDHFLNQDRYHYFPEELLRGRFVLSNKSGKRLEGICKITIEDKKDIFGIWEKEFDADPGMVIELGQPGIEMPYVEEAVCLTLKAELQWGEETYQNRWPVWVYPSQLTDRKIFVLDPAERLEGIEQKFSVLKIGRYEDLAQLQKGDILVTTLPGEAVEAAAARGAGVLLLVQDDAYYPVVKVPFYREGIIKIQEHPAVAHTAHRGYAGIQYFGVASECALDKIKLEAREGAYQSLIRRYDARKFFVCEYAAELKRGTGKILISTLNMGGARGEQPSGLLHNHFGIYLLNEWIKYLDRGGSYEDGYEIGK